VERAVAFVGQITWDLISREEDFHLKKKRL
jgi:hypothetical protein